MFWWTFVGETFAGLLLRHGVFAGLAAPGAARAPLLFSRVPQGRLALFWRAEVVRAALGAVSLLDVLVDVRQRSFRGLFLRGLFCSAEVEGLAGSSWWDGALVESSWGSLQRFASISRRGPFRAAALFWPVGPS